MSFIDWSDPEEMLGLLVDHVADELVATQDDGDRAEFLRGLSQELLAASGSEVESADAIVPVLRAIHASQPREFATDPVMMHVAACIDELARLCGAAPERSAR